MEESRKKKKEEEAKSPSNGSFLAVILNQDAQLWHPIPYSPTGGGMTPASRRWSPTNLYL